MSNDFETWGERLFPPAIVGKLGKKAKTDASTNRVAYAQTNPKSSTKNTLSPKTKAKLILKNAPEVMVKITGNSKGMNKLVKHVDYVSRNGNVELEDQNGLTYLGKGACNDILQDWKDSQDIPELEKEGTKREVLNIVLSMPAKTNRDAVKNAAREFALETFPDHEWLMAEHRDEEHPHVHIVVKMTDDFGRRLNPRKADLQAWRETFAVKLHEQGIEANATKRVARGQTKRPKTQARHHAIKQKRPLTHDQTRRQEVVDAIKSKTGIPDTHYVNQARKTREAVIQNAIMFAKELSNSGDPQLAKSIENHYKKLPALETEQQEALRKYKDKQMQKEPKTRKEQDKSK